MLGHFGWGGGRSSGSAKHTEIPAFPLSTWVLSLSALTRFHLS